MSAAEVIELIKKLSPEERAEVMAFARNGEAEVLPAERKIRYISNEEFDKIAPKIFADNHELLRRLAQ